MFSDISMWQFIIIAVSAMFIGFGKAGIAGINIVAIPVFAAILGAKPSTGFILPLLILADAMAVIYYRKDTQWSYLIKLSPWVLIGVVIATFVGEYISESTFKTILGVVVIIGIVMMVIKDYTKISDEFFTNKYFTISMGLLGGFTSMIGNAAGPIMGIYFLSVSLPKNEFIATKAWFFFIINVLKLPLHIFMWQTISIQSLTDGLKLVIFIIIGTIIGFRLVKYMKEAFYRKLIIILILLSALALFYKG
jgi:uncharacterized protein